MVSMQADPTCSTILFSVLEAGKDLLTVMMNREMGGEHLHLVNLLIRFRHYKAIDERDKVFGLIGVAREVHRTKLPTASYGKSIETVYCEVAQYIFNTSPYSQTFDILGYAHDFDDPSFVAYDSLLGNLLPNIPDLLLLLQEFAQDTAFIESEERADEVFGPLFKPLKPIVHAIRQSLCRFKDEPWFVSPTSKEHEFLDFFFGMVERGLRNDGEVPHDEKKRWSDFGGWFDDYKPEIFQAI